MPKRDEAAAHKKAWDTRGRAQEGGGSGAVTTREDWVEVESARRSAHSLAVPTGGLSYQGLTKDSPEVKAVADRRHARGVADEPEMTATVMATAAASGGTVAGLQFRLKSASGIADKAIRDAVEKRIHPTEAIEQMNDVNRYTITFPADELVERALRAQRALSDAGWDPYDTKLKNSFGPGLPYQGYNAVYVNRKTGAKFELQFHTPESLEIKEKAHLIYEKRRNLPAAHADAKKLDMAMMELWQNYRRPIGWERLPGVILRPTG